MPNGSPDFKDKELPLLEAFFSKISRVLVGFADSHNLLIQRYYHEGPSWAFMFRHPDDGVGQVEVQKTEDDCIIVRAYWWIDDYDNSTRFMKCVTVKKFGLDYSELRETLENALSGILQWKKDQLVPHRAPHPWSKRCSKEEFYRQYEKLPELKGI